MNLVGPARVVTVAGDAQRQVRVARVVDRFAVVERLKSGQLVDVLFDQVGQPVQKLTALCGRHLGPRATFKRPPRGLDGFVDVSLVGLGHVGDDFAGSRIKRLERLAAGGVHPFAVDQQLGLPDFGMAVFWLGRFGRGRFGLFRFRVAIRGFLFRRSRSLFRRGSRHGHHSFAITRVATVCQESRHAMPENRCKNLRLGEWYHREGGAAKDAAKDEGGRMSQTGLLSSVERAKQGPVDRARPSPAHRLD